MSTGCSRITQAKKEWSISVKCQAAFSHAEGGTYLGLACREMIIKTAENCARSLSPSICTQDRSKGLEVLDGKFEAKLPAISIMHHDS